MRDKDKALDTLTHEELGLDPAELGGNPWTAAGVSFCLFSLGTIFPAMPFVWAHGVSRVVQCVVASAIGLAAIGIFTSLFNGRSAMFGNTSSRNRTCRRSIHIRCWSCSGRVALLNDRRISELFSNSHSSIRR